MSAAGVSIHDPHVARADEVVTPISGAFIGLGTRRGAMSISLGLPS
jgi:hypothetical protein